MRTVFFIPPLAKLSGGLASIYELAEILLEQGRTVAVTAPSEKTPGLDGLSPEIARLSWDAIQKAGPLSKNDIWCVPESWPNALAPGINQGAWPLVYAQSWIYLLTTLPPQVSWRQLPVCCLAVSGAVDWFMREVLGVVPEAVLPPSVGAEFFAAGAGRPADTAANRPVRVAWMPRKHKTLAGHIRQIAASRLERDGAEIAVEFVEIENMTRPQVAEALAGADIFLATAFPEGFGLPPLEAMACGCVPVGFSGLGGFDYLRNPEPATAGEAAGALFRPPFELPDKGWGGNSLVVSDGDVLGAGLALAQAIILAAAGEGEWGELRANAALAAQAYSREKRAAAVAGIWPELVRKFSTEATG